MKFILLFRASKQKRVNIGNTNYVQEYLSKRKVGKLSTHFY